MQKGAGEFIHALNWGESETIWHKAVNYKQLQLLNSLIHSDKKNIDKKNSLGETALYKAVVLGQLTQAQMLLNHGANPNEGTNKKYLLESIKPYFKTMLQEAITQSNLPLIKLLVEKGANLNLESDNHSPFYYAALMGNPQVMDYLKNQGALWKACEYEKLQTLQILPGDYYQAVKQYLNQYKSNLIQHVNHHDDKPRLRVIP